MTDNLISQQSLGFLVTERSKAPFEIRCATCKLRSFITMAEAAKEIDVASADAAFMGAAASSAIAGVTLQHGGPFGAVVVKNGIFVSTAHNTVRPQRVQAPA